MMKIDYTLALNILQTQFLEAENFFLNKSDPPLIAEISSDFDILFLSQTQAYREVMLGCILARIIDKSIDIRLPYINLGKNAYNGRTLDEQVINPFLQEKQVPSSKGPFLSVFRRSVTFSEATKDGLRDKSGYEAFLRILNFISKIENTKELLYVLLVILYHFVALREDSKIELSHLKKVSLEQIETLISGLLNTQSGGRLPVFIILAAFSSIKKCFNLDWDISFQGINVADKASGAGGDITIKSGDRIILAAEITERPIDHARVISTFNTKISTGGIEDYLFFSKSTTINAEIAQQTRQYFSQGYEVNFIEIKNWIIMTMATLGKTGRESFINELINFLRSSDVPKSLKVKWNEEIARLTRI